VRCLNNADFSGSRNNETSAITLEIYHHEHKFPHEIVSELNGRIEKSIISPFDRFRSQRGMLSVSPVVLVLTSGH
jgi:hypothetical protein